MNEFNLPPQHQTLNKSIKIMYNSNSNYNLNLNYNPFMLQIEQDKNKYNMHSKLQAYLQQYGNKDSRNFKLPPIYQSPFLQSKAIHKVNERKSQECNSSNLTNSIYKKEYNRAIILKNRTKRIMTQDSMLDYNRLDKIEQRIMMQIKNIDICLQSQRNDNKDKLQTSLFHGFIFLNQINQFVIQRFHECLRIQSDASNAIIQGFDVPKYLYGPNGQPEIVNAYIIKKVTSINNKLLDKSIKAIKEYDCRKKNQYQKNYGKQWSLFKRINSRNQGQLDSDKCMVNSSNESKVTFVRSMAKRDQSTSTNLFDSKITSNNLKRTFINDISFLKRSRQTKNYSVKTQSSQVQDRSRLIVNLTKKDVKMMLNKHRNIVSIWVPPASYPQFFGIFTYEIIKMQKTQFSTSTAYKCKISRYFFYKFGLTKKVFDAMIDWVIHQSNLMIDYLEITVQKSLYSQIFVKFGWVLRFWQSANKVKAIYQKSLKTKTSQSKS